MSDKPGEHLEEEPQEERGPEGSRDTGSDEPAAGPSTVQRAPATRSPTPRSTPRERQDPDAPDLPSGTG